MRRRAGRRAAAADRGASWRRCASSVRQFTERELQQRNYDYMEKFRRESAAREELLQPDRGGDPQDARGGRRASPSGSRTCSRSAGAGSSAASSTCTPMLRRNMAHGGVPVRADLQAAQEGPPEARDPVRRFVLGRERLALHAPVRLQLQECFTKIRAFVFVAELGEVTPLFQERTSARRSRRRSTAAT